MELSKAMQDVVAERERQQDVEGWAPAHDDEHAQAQLAHAGAAYALVAAMSDEEKEAHKDALDGERRGFRSLIASIWPWDASWFKPKDERRDLVRAAALLVAEIERLDREA